MSDTQQELFPCPVCHRKFIKKSLEVHLRSCDKKGKYTGGHNIGYDNKAFLDRLDKAMEAEQKHSGYKPSQKKKGQEEYNKDFLNKLDKAMEAEEKHSGYKPYQKKEVKQLSDQEIFENNLNKALEQEQKNSGYHPSGKQAGKKPQPKNQQQDFLNRLDKAMEAEEKNPTYKPSEHNPKNPRPKINEEAQLRNDFEQKLKIMKIF